MTPEELARLKELEAMEALEAQFLGQAAPQNQAVLEQSMSDIPVIDPATGRTATSPVPVSAPVQQQGFQRGADFSGARPQDEPITAEQFNEAFVSIPGMPPFLEFAQSLQLGTAATIDLFGGPDFVNAIMATAGSDKRVPTATGAYKDFMYGEGGSRPDYMEAGSTGQQAARTGGEFATIGAGLAKVLQQIPKLIANPQTLEGGRQVGNQVMQQLGKTADVGKDFVYGATGGGAAAYGKEYGGLPGEVAASFLAPLSIGVAAPIIKTGFQKAFNGDLSGLSKYVGELNQFNEKDASIMIAKQLEAEGLSVEQAMKTLDDLGPEAMLADLGGSFRSLLRMSANVYPRIFADAGRETAERAKGQPERILKAFDDASGTSSLDADGEVLRLDKIYKPQIDKLYQQVREKGLAISDKVRGMLDKSPTLKKASGTAQDMIDDARARGETPGNIDFINNIKIVLDDQINKLVSQGGAESGKIANLVALKRSLVDEADLAIPEYKIAREKFASQKDLEQAVEVGRNIFKLSEKPKDFKALIDDMSPAQIKLAKLGVKDAVIDKFNRSKDTADTINQVFNVRGNLDKAKYLWGDDVEGFNRFRDAMKKESEFVFTRNEAIGGSTTARQAHDIVVGDRDQQIGELIKIMKDRETWKDIVGRKIVALFDESDSVAKVDALETVGDLLLIKGMEPARIKKILNSDPKDVQKILLDSINDYNAPATAPAVEIGASELITE